MKYEIQEDQTLLEALGKMSPDSTVTSLRSWVKEGRITVDGRLAKITSAKLHKGQLLVLNPKPAFAGVLRIYYEDRDIVVIEKPMGLLSVATAFEKGDTAHAILKDHYRPGRVFVVHRLDQDTSGVMIFARSEEARDQLKVIFEAHDIERKYIAIVEGQVSPESGTWKSYIFEDDNYLVHTTTNTEKGQLAITHYEVLDTAKRYTGLSLTLETGRKNQIRVHCQEAGHSIVGDKKYGATTNPVKRLCLHAHLLAFKHPITKKPMYFESPIPEIFHTLVPLR